MTKDTKALSKREITAIRTREDILDVATHEFSAKGLAGARIDEIAERTATSKRMIYYHFGSKDGLYQQVLQRAYDTIRNQEQDARFEDLPPEQALRAIIGHNFDYHSEHPEFVRLVMNENMERGAYLAQSKSIQQLNVPAIAAIQELYARGVAQEVFRPGLDAIAHRDAVNHHFNVVLELFIQRRGVFDGVKFAINAQAGIAAALPFGDFLFIFALARPHQPAIEQRQTRHGHQDHQQRGDHHPGSVALVGDRCRRCRSSASRCRSRNGGCRRGSRRRNGCSDIGWLGVGRCRSHRRGRRRLGHDGGAAHQQTQSQREGGT